jgi:hypothetical protein
VIRMSERLQIEGPKLGHLRNKRYFISADQCECYYFHIFSLSVLLNSFHLDDPSFGPDR